MNYVSAQEAVQEIKSGDRVFIQSAAMTPLELVDAMSNRYESLENVEVIHIHTEGAAKYTQEPYNQAFHTNALFVGANTRDAVNTGWGSYTPMFLGEIHYLFRKNILPLDVVMVQVSPPDKHGYCSLGVSVDITLPAVLTAKKIIAQVNPNVPRSHGDGIVHISRISAAVATNNPIYAIEMPEPTETDIQIGTHIAGLV